jgi:hypothetical protein
MHPEKKGYSKDELAKACKNCDEHYATKVNRHFMTLLHNARFPADCKRTGLLEKGKVPCRLQAHFGYFKTPKA